MCFQALFPAALAFGGNIFIHFRVYLIFHLPTFHVFEASGSWPDFIQGAPALFSGITRLANCCPFDKSRWHREQFWVNSQVSWLLMEFSIWGWSLVISGLFDIRWFLGLGVVPYHSICWQSVNEFLFRQVSPWEHTRRFDIPFYARAPVCACDFACRLIFSFSHKEKYREHLCLFPWFIRSWSANVFFQPCSASCGLP